MRRAHEEATAHGGRNAMYHEITKRYYWPKIYESITNFLNECETCLRSSQKNQGGSKFISTAQPLEKIGVDLLFLDQQTPVLIAIDYFTRKGWCEKIESKEPDSIRGGLEKLLCDLGSPKMIITDSGTEFVNFIVKSFLFNANIEHHVISPNKHQSNRRVERLNRTIWQSIRRI